MGWADGDELPVEVDLYVGGADGWVDVTEDVRLSSAHSGGGVSITRGRSAEGTVAAPGSASLVLDNRSGAYSSRNPRSPYFGLLGRNTPVRIGIELAADDFGRTVASGWGTADSGQTWDATGGTSVDFAVGSGAATINHPTINALRWTDLDVQLVDVEQVSDIATSAAVTGAALVTGHIARYDPVTGDNYWFRLEFNAGASTVTLKIAKWYSSALTELAELADVPGVTYTAGQPLRLRSSVVDGRLSMRVWDPDDPEPAGWHLTTTDTDITDAGRVGIMTWVISGNTNSPALTVSVDAYQAVDRRAVMEVPSWPPRWTSDGSDAWTPIQAAGILRRLSRTRRPLRSALYRLLSSSSPIAYWPMEDGVDARQAASGADGGAPMVIASGAIDFQSDGPPGSAGSAAVVDSVETILTGTVSGPTSTEWQASFWCRGTPVDATNNFFSPLLVVTPAFLVLVSISNAAGGSFVSAAVNVLDATTEVSLASLALAGSDPGFMDGEWHLLQVTAAQSGGSVDFELYADGELADTVTVASLTCATPTAVRLPYSLGAIEATDTGVAHIAIHGSATLVDQWDAGQGYAGETAGNRLIRLGAEDGIPVAVQGDPDDTELMGPQGLRTWYDLVGECAAVDMGILYEPRETLGLAYRTRASLYNQAALLEADYTDLAPPLEPEPDDFAITNDVTVSRPDGSSAQVVLESGPLSIRDPPDGVGVYDEAVTLNAAEDWQLPHLASWLRGLGTWDEARYPRVTARLHGAPWRTDSELTARAAALDSGRVLAIDGLPDWLPPGPIQLMAQGPAEHLDAFERTLTWVMEPAEPYTVGVVEDEVLGRADTDGMELASDFTAGTDTSMSVTVTAGPAPILTSTHAAMFPFDIQCGGVVLTVTGISGASSPYTFTVTQAPVNGITGVIAAGTPLSLAHPWRAAL